MISGPAPGPELLVSTTARTVADNGRRSAATTAAPTPTATAGVRSNPGSFAAMRPAAAPRNSAGNTGPPRKLPSERL
jgi:hypothetical protein